MHLLNNVSQSDFFIFYLLRLFSLEKFTDVFFAGAEIERPKIKAVTTEARMVNLKKCFIVFFLGSLNFNKYGQFELFTVLSFSESTGKCLPAIILIVF